MAKSIKELTFSTTNRVGVLDKVTQSLKQARVNIQHICAWSEGSKAYFCLVTNSNARARKVLSKMGIRAGEKDGLILNLRNKVGALGRVARRLAKANVNIACISATSSGKKTAVLLHTSNNRKASRVI